MVHNVCTLHYGFSMFFLANWQHGKQNEGDMCRGMSVIFMFQLLNITTITRLVWRVRHKKFAIRKICTTRNMLWKWNNQHVMSVGQRKNLSPQWDSNLWPSEHWAGALSTWATENSWRVRPYIRFIFDAHPAYC